MSHLLLAFQPNLRPSISRIQPTKTHFNRSRLPILTANASDPIANLLSTLSSSQVTVGSVIGFSTGFAVKRIGQFLLVLVGMEVVALQLMAQRKWVVVNWDLIQHDLSPHADKGRLERVYEAMQRKAPFAGSFGIGFWAGLQWS